MRQLLAIYPKLVCIFCGEELSPGTKPEHILLDALGGRKTTQRVICSRHNNRFGSGIDDALAEEVKVLRNLLQLESGTGKAPPALRNLQAGSERINIGKDGRPDLVKPPFAVTELPEGTAEVNIYARTLEHLAKMIPHLAAKLRLPEDELIEQIKKGQAALVEMRPPEMHHSVGLGGEEALRSVAKSCLVLLATVKGNDALRAVPFDAVRDFILNGDPEFNKTRIKIDSRDVPGLDHLKNRFGPFFNLIYIRSNDAGRVIGHCTMYNAISWQIILAEADGPPAVTAALISNPLDPRTWSDDATALPDIPFDWLDAANRTYEIARARERFILIIEHHVSKARETEVTRVCNDVFEKHGVTSDDQPITDPATQQKIIGEIQQRLRAHALGLRHEDPLTPAEIEAMLRGGK
jgi:hypothetical protein